MSAMPVEEAATPTISLIVSTLGRRCDELLRLMRSVREQDQRPMEVIIVDQSTGGRLHEQTPSFPDDGPPVIWTTSERGLSKGRNAGLALASGALVGFPDDDCWYPPEVLSRVVREFAGNPSLMGLTGVTRDAAGSLSTTRFDAYGGGVSPRRAWRQGVEPAMFFRRELFDAIGAFNEELGVGSSTPYQSGEGTELLIRAVKAGQLIRFEPTLCVRHANPSMPRGPQGRARARSYGRGIGRVLRLTDAPKAEVATVFVRPLGGAILALMHGRTSLASTRLWSAIGRAEGWLARP